MQDTPVVLPLPHFTRTRLAPTPSGYLHLGNILSFSLTAYLARETGARILLRIDDLDRTRCRPAYVADIFQSLTYLGIPWDEGPEDVREHEATYSQRHRLGRYEAALTQLRERALLYGCSCSRGQLPGGHPCPAAGIPLTAPHLRWRLRTSADSHFPLKLLGRPPEQATLPAPMQDFTVRRKDGIAAYQLASVVDDDYFGVDLVVRGRDLRDSSLAQLYLAQVVGENSFRNVTLHHHRLLTAGGSALKLSKSAGATSIQYLRRQGLSPAAIFSVTARMAGCEEQPEDYRSLAAAVWRREW